MNQVTALQVHFAQGSCNKAVRQRSDLLFIETSFWFEESINDITGPAAAADKLSVYESSGFISHTWDMFLGVNPAYNGVLYRVRLLQ